VEIFANGPDSSAVCSGTKGRKLGAPPQLFHSHASRPFFMRYDHLHYSRWETIYVNEMHQLPSELLEEFLSGSFVVRRSTRKFNQVDPDQSQEWLNATGKKEVV